VFRLVRTWRVVVEKSSVVSHEAMAAEIVPNFVLIEVCEHAAAPE
jgi:hypothetical protein